MSATGECGATPPGQSDAGVPYISQVTNAEGVALTFKYATVNSNGNWLGNECLLKELRLGGQTLVSYDYLASDSKGQLAAIR